MDFAIAPQTQRRGPRPSAESGRGHDPKLKQRVWVMSPSWRLLPPIVLGILLLG